MKVTLKVEKSEMANAEEKQFTAPSKNCAGRRQSVVLVWFNICLFKWNRFLGNSIFEHKAYLLCFLCVCVYSHITFLLYALCGNIAIQLLDELKWKSKPSVLCWNSIELMIHTQNIYVRINLYVHSHK